MKSWHGQITEYVLSMYYIPCTFDILTVQIEMSRHWIYWQGVVRCCCQKDTCMVERKSTENHLCSYRYCVVATGFLAQYHMRSLISNWCSVQLACIKTSCRDVKFKSQYYYTCQDGEWIEMCASVTILLITPSTSSRVIMYTSVSSLTSQ